ncbi:MAG: HAD-IB family phosphatase [Candidatus Margulisiibacteriota bacterium]
MTTLVIFDIDGTLTLRDSLIDFTGFGIRYHPLRFLTGFALYLAFKCRLISHPVFYHAWVWVCLKHLNQTTAELLFDRWVQTRFPKILKPSARLVLRHYQNQNIPIVLLSANIAPLVSRIAAALKVQTWFATELQTTPTTFTGHLNGPILRGTAKKDCLLAHFKASDLVNAAAYGNERSDLPLLSCVGHPILVSKKTELPFPK